MDEIDVRAAGQNYALISFVSPTSAQRSGVLGFRVYGAFETLEDARAHASRVNAADAAFDVYVVEMRKWCAWHPDPMDVEEKVYTDKRLDEMIRAHRDAQEDAQRAYEERLASVSAVNPAGEKSDGTRTKEDEDGDTAGGHDGLQDHAQDGDGVPHHVPE
jgi:hypothetical protein